MAKVTRHEVLAQKELEALREQRRNRFRILACVDGSEASYDAVRFAARIGRGDECDIIILNVRLVDHGLRSGGLQVSVARQNMLDWGLDLPSLRYLKRGLEVLKEEGISPEDWKSTVAHSDVWGDPLGDNKVEYRKDSGQSVVLKLKTAANEASGILDQYELGPYNLMILGEPSRWRSDVAALFGGGVAQKVAMLAPCSVMIARKSLNKKGFFICTDGSERCLTAVRQAAVLAQYAKHPITLFSVARDRKRRDAAHKIIEECKAALKEMKIRVMLEKTAVGDPVEQIIRHGSNHFVTVVSDSGRGRFTRIFQGSVAYGVMRGAKNAVLTVR